MCPEEIARFAKIKGLNIVGTGDFTHPRWLKELQETLIPESNTGLYKIARNPESPVYFMITTEVCTIFTFENEVKKVHHVILTPNMETAIQINDRLAKYGNLTIDGRPTLNMDAPHLVEEVIEVSRQNMVFPAHCVPPGTYIYTPDGLKRIEEVKVGDYVFTHTGHARKVLKTFKRMFKEKLISIVSRYFQEGFLLTPEHPAYAIRTYKNCRWTKGVCKPTCSTKGKCKYRFYERYKAEWIQAKDLQVGDILVYPRIKEVINVKEIPFSSNLKASGNFCRLIGYYLADGYVYRDGIGFSFSKGEGKYIEDVITIMNRIFGLSPKIDNRHGVDLIYYSKELAQFFGKQCYIPRTEKRAWNKCVPNWMLFLPQNKQVELIRGWWRGDRGVTSSKVLAHQMKFIFLRLDILPSLGLQKKLVVDAKNLKIGKRRLHAKHDDYYFYWLSLFDEKVGEKLREKCFNKYILQSKHHYGWGDSDYFYLPIRKIGMVDYDGFVYNLEVDEDNSYLTTYSVLHNCWTPWFSIFGAFSGFNSVEECYQDMTKYIYALETGLSCYDEKTEVLTESGWKKFSEIRYSDKICTLSLKTDEIEFQNPIGIFTYKYKGKMYRLKTKRVDLLVTPNHKLLYSPCDFQNPKPFELKEAEFLFNKSKRFKKDGIWIGKNENYFILPAVKIKHGNRYHSGFRIKKEKKIPMKVWLKFFGFWLAEGWVNEGKNGDYDVCLSNLDPNLLNDVKELLQSFGYKVYQWKNRLRIRDFQLFHYLKQFGKSSEKFIPSEIKSLSRGLLEILLEYYLKGDGHIYGRAGKGLSATTTSIRLRDDLQEIALKIGISAYYKLGSKKGKIVSLPYKGNVYKQKENAWAVYFIRRNRPGVFPSTIKKFHHIESWVNYDGLVYCVAVPNQVMFVRRDGIPLWCGNSDPPMNWRLSKLDSFVLVSNSDSHSFWPWRIGREANVFELKKLSYREIVDAIRLKDVERFKFTIETDPAYGKYHWTGHRNCHVTLSPQEAVKLGNVCPVCRKKLTTGVEQRVEELADRPAGFKPRGVVGFVRLLPLSEIIATVLCVDSPSTQQVWSVYNLLVERFGNEYSVLIDASKEALSKVVDEKIAEAIVRVREGRIRVVPGYDGVYGQLVIFGEQFREKPLLQRVQQLNLTDFM